MHLIFDILQFEILSSMKWIVQMKCKQIGGVAIHILVKNSFSKVKFIYSEKATKFCKISTLLLSVYTVVKSMGEISQNFVASEYMNCNNNQTNLISVIQHQKLSIFQQLFRRLLIIFLHLLFVFVIIVHKQGSTF